MHDAPGGGWLSPAWRQTRLDPPSPADTVREPRHTHGGCLHPGCSLCPLSVQNFLDPPGHKQNDVAVLVRLKTEDGACSDADDCSDVNHFVPAPTR